jgi:hypothetical protein
MSNNKQSSVEWLVEQIKKDINLRLRGFDIDKAFEQAKAMHHKEVVDFVEDWYCNGPLLGGGVDVAATIEEHYKETFGGNNG